MIVKKTKQLGNFKKGINLYVPRRSSASRVPTTHPISTPTLYFSGLTFAGSYSDATDFHFENPYSKFESPPYLIWRGNNFDSFYTQLLWSSSSQWTVSCACYDADSQPTNVTCAYNPANATAIPLTGWTYQSDLVVGGTLVISTTP
jgi:hypothetical protein